MNKRFTFTTVFFFMVISFPGFGQLKLGLKVGISANGASYRVNKVGPGVNADEVEKRGRESIKWQAGYTIGLAAEYSLTDALSLQSGLELSRKGYRIKSEETNSFEIFSITVGSKGKSAVSYLEIPMNLAYKFHSFQIHAGPYLGLGLAGNGKLEHKYSSTYLSKTSIYAVNTWEGNYVFRTRIKESDMATFRFSQEYVQRLDAGLNLGLSYLLGPIVVSTTFSHGFRNIQPPLPDQEDNDRQAIYLNQSIRLAATWYFRNF